MGVGGIEVGGIGVGGVGEDVDSGFGGRLAASLLSILSFMVQCSVKVTTSLFWVWGAVVTVAGDFLTFAMREIFVTIKGCHALALILLKKNILKPAVAWIEKIPEASSSGRHR